MVDRVVPFESLRAEIEAVVLRPASEKSATSSARARRFRNRRDGPARRVIGSCGRPTSTGEVEAAVILKSVGRIPADFDIA
jgi:hypothetical protein